MTQVYEVSEEEMNALTQSILTRYGIDFTCYEPKSLRRRIIRLMNIQDIPSAHELWVRFLKDSKFISVFMNEISVGMTSMFRDPQLWKSIKSLVRSEYQKTKTDLKIWHAGCSTGEEVYSMGILLSEVGMLQSAKALATDINQNAIKEAQEGEYHKIKMIENESNYKMYNQYSSFDNYYEAGPKNVKLKSSLINHVEFKYHNLITDEFPTGFDIILCRNVMIYFDGIAKARLIEKFYKSLNPGGLFIIGYFDTLNSLIDNNKFTLLEGETRIFRKT